MSLSDAPSNGRLAAELMDQLTVPIYVIDRNYFFVYANKRFCEVLDIQAASVTGKNFWRLFDEHKYAETKIAFEHFFETRTPTKFEVTVREFAITVEVRLKPWKDHLLVEMVDITKYRSAEFELENQLQSVFHVASEATASASTDILTGILNRRGGEEVAGVIFRGTQFSKMTFSALMIDVDHFKSINDSFGHVMGDEVLKLVASALKEATLESETVARFGGEEFVVFCPKVGIGEAKERAEVFLEAIRKVDFPLRAVTASIGVASLADGDEAWSEVVERADRAMYLAKQRGRNQLAAWVEDRELSPQMRMSS